MSFSPLDLIKKGAQRVLDEGKQAVTDFKTNSGSFAANNPLGFIKNVVKEVPGSANQAVKDIVRGGTSVALETGEAIPRVLSSVLGKGDVAQMVVPPKEIPGRVGKYIGPIQSISSQFNQRKQQGQGGFSNAAEAGLDLALNEPAGIALKPVLAVGSIVGKPLADLLFKRFGKSGKILTEATDPGIITQELNKMGVPEDVQQHALPDLINAKTPEEAQSVIANSYDVVQPKFQGGKFNPPDTYDASAISRNAKNSFFNDSSTKFEKPDRFDGLQQSYNEAKTGKTATGEDLPGRIVVGKDEQGNIVLKDGRALLEGYRDLKLPVPKNKVVFEDGVTEAITKGKKLPALFTGEKLNTKKAAEDTYYHGTTKENAEAISKSGFNPKGAKAENNNLYTFVTKDKDFAKNYSKEAGDGSTIVEATHKGKLLDVTRLFDNRAKSRDLGASFSKFVDDFGTARSPKEIQTARHIAEEIGQGNQPDPVYLRDNPLFKEWLQNNGYDGYQAINNGRVFQAIESSKVTPKEDLKIKPSDSKAATYSDTINKIAASNDPAEIEAILRTTKVPEENIPAMAKRLANVDSPRMVKNSIEGFRTQGSVKNPLESLQGRSTSRSTELARAQAETLENQAQTALDRAPRQFRKDIVSLPDIIKSEPTPVKLKVNVLDYFRTPDRVLKKIGLGPESTLIKRKYDDYVRELPKNIEKIREWSKRVPTPEANEKIFKFLDGQRGIVLNKDETKVAYEIKAWLEQWADRLNLPKDNRIASYITHIFDKELLSKEFDEELAKIIADKVPGEVYDPFLEKRLGALGYKQDTWAALDAYVKRATRKAHMDEALEQLQYKVGHSLEFSKVEQSQFKYIQRYINNINMRPTELDNLLDNSIKSLVGYKYGQRPVTAITRFLRQMTYRGMLGINPGSALRNLSQGVNTYATLGEKYTALGYASLFNKGAMKELEESGIMGSAFIQDQNLSATKKLLEKIDKGLFIMFEGAEKINRGAAYFGAKRQYIDKFKPAVADGKMTVEQLEKKAEEYARGIVRKTQFSFGSVDSPVALQSDIMKTLGQFQTFTLKQTEFLAELVKNKNYIGIVRYVIAGLVFVNTVGRAFNMKTEELLPNFRFDTPPSLKLPVEIIKAAADSPDKYGADRDLVTKAKDIGNATLGIIPGASQIKKTYQGIKAVKEGGSFDKGGNIQFEQKQTPAAKVQSILFGKNSSKEAQTYFDKEDKQSKEDIKTIKPVYDEIKKLMAEGKEAEAQEKLDSLGDKGYTVFKKIAAAEKAEQTKQGKREALPIYQKVKKLVKEGKEDEAAAILEGLSDDEYHYYELVLKQLEK